MYSSFSELTVELESLYPASLLFQQVVLLEARGVMTTARKTSDKQLEQDVAGKEEHYYVRIHSTGEKLVGFTTTAIIIIL